MLLIFICLYFFFFKQKTAYEMRISDWSSDVCSSDLDLALTFLRGVIFGIFRKVAMRARFLDRIDDQGSLGLERRELGSHLLIAFCQHRHLFNACHYPVVLRQKSSASETSPGGCAADPSLSGGGAVPSIIVLKRLHFKTRSE